MPPKGAQKTKEAKAKAAAGGGAKKKKKWGKGKMREKLMNLVLFDEPTWERLLVEVPKMKLITSSTISERLKINSSLARASIKELIARGLIRQVRTRGKCIARTASRARALSLSLSPPLSRARARACVRSVQRERARDCPCTVLCVHHRGDTHRTHTSR